MPYVSSPPQSVGGELPITWELAFAPAGATIHNVTGVVSWPNPILRSDAYNFIVRAVNPIGETDQTLWVTVTASYNVTTDISKFEGRRRLLGVNINGPLNSGDALRVSGSCISILPGSAGQPRPGAAVTTYSIVNGECDCCIIACFWGLTRAEQVR